MLVAPLLLRERTSERAPGSGSPLEIQDLRGLVFRLVRKNQPARLLVSPGGVTSTTGLLRVGPLVRPRQARLDCGPTILVSGMVGPRLGTGPVLSLGPETALPAVPGLRSRLRQADHGRCLLVGSGMVTGPLLLALRLHVLRPWLRPWWRDVLVSRVGCYMDVHVWWMRHVIPAR